MAIWYCCRPRECFSQPPSPIRVTRRGPFNTLRQEGIIMGKGNNSQKKDKKDKKPKKDAKKPEIKSIVKKD